MGKDYEIQKGQENGPCVIYFCPECGHQIASLLSDAGSTDNCSTCGKARTVPGEAEWQLLQETETAREAERQELQEAEKSKQDSTSRFTVEWVFHEPVEAAVAKAALEEAGIPYLEDESLTDAYDFVSWGQVGWGRILLREQDVEGAREVIQEALKPCPLEDAEDGPEGDDEAEPEAE
jgi:DNA-directed RNA polymerase subunit M/transcription elongation factor TFIIS